MIWIFNVLTKFLFFAIVILSVSFLTYLQDVIHRAPKNMSLKGAFWSKTILISVIILSKKKFDLIELKFKSGLVLNLLLSLILVESVEKSIQPEILEWFPTS